MKQSIILITLIITLFTPYKKIFSVVPKEIAKKEIFAVRYYKKKSLELKAHKKVPKSQWKYLKHYWRVFYNKSENVIAETLYVRGRRIAYWSYKYLADGRIIRKGFHWGGIRGGVYYDMGWKRYVLKRGFSYYSARFSYEVYNSDKKLVYREYYLKGRFDHFIRIYYDNYGNALRTVRSHKKHLRGAYFDYVYNGKGKLPHSKPGK